MRLSSRFLPLGAIVVTVVAAGPVLAWNGGGDSTTVPAPDALQAVYLEAEDLLPALESSRRPASGSPAIGARQEVSGLFSSNAGVLLTNLDEGTRLTLRFAVSASGAYGFVARIGVGPDHGIVQPAIDGRPLGERFDGYAPEAGRSEELILGRVALSQGDHTVTSPSWARARRRRRSTRAWTTYSSSRKPDRPRTATTGHDRLPSRRDRRDPAGAAKWLLAAGRARVARGVAGVGVLGLARVRRVVGADVLFGMLARVDPGAGRGFLWIALADVALARVVAVWS